MYENKVYEYEDKIESGEMRPEEVDVYDLVYDEETHLTPKLEELLTPEQREEFARLQRQKIDEKASSRVAEKSESHQAAIEAIRDPEIDRTHTVELNEVELEVKNFVNGKIERKLLQAGKIDAGEADDDEAGREATIDVMTWFIEGPEPYDGPGVWRDYAEAYGAQELAGRALQVAEPYFKRREELSDVDTFRGDR